MTFKPALTHRNRTTTQLQVIIETQIKILQAVQAALPENLAAEVKACVVKETKLLVYADSAVWSSQLRFFSQTIQAAANRICDGKIDKIQLKVQQPIRDFPEKKSRKKIPSQINIDALISSQLQAPESDLKQALLSLSSTLKDLSSAR